MFHRVNKPRIVIAGQVPPPFGGQNIMIRKALAQFARSDRCHTVHLPFFFTPDFKTARKGSPGKVLELIRVIARVFRIRMGGPIDVLLYPTGGPQTVPLIRDVLLLPWVLMFSRRVILYFHAAGIADRMEKNRGSLLNRVVRSLYGKTFAAIIMTEFNRRDPEAIGIERIATVPYRIDDDFDPQLVHRTDSGAARLLYAGHLCADKGTVHLIEAFAALRRTHPDLELDLAGECLPPFTHEILQRLLEQFHVRDHVRLLGLLTGRDKAAAFGSADLFVFPTVAPYESFGLVLAEAMSWKLPIVASKWRGNSDVLTSRAGSVVFPVSASLAQDIASGLEDALRRRSEWHEWGQVNRAIFEERYRDRAEDEWLVGPVLSLLKAE
jgi:glycosyltransferase involved in cell wall biosynthesis